MKNIRYLIVIIAFFTMLSCSVQSKLNKQFIGKDKTVLDKYYGQNGVIVPLSADKQVVTYTQSKTLRSTAINKGVTTLDPMISPSVQKRQKFIFYLNKEGKVIDCKYDLEYQH